MTTFEELINYSFYIFEHNFIEFETAIDIYTEELYSQDIKAFDLRNRHIQAQKFEEVKRETARLLHNYLASWYSLKQQTYAAENSLDKSLTNDSLILEIKSKKEQMFTDNPENTFLQDLRNYIQHRSLPLIETKNSIGFKIGQDINIDHSLYLDTNKLLQWDKWTKDSKQYLSEHSEKIPIKQTIKSNFAHIQNFYQWLSGRLD
ncbi:hypothetical protein [Trichormus variabilis]|uniref:Uncharacterized protein n=1 Tax=Trichormus variabilis SAG 1403-4b TaxID=447716 RepID=A0A3S1BXU1_ANAVA|nr:hypothetical protein [Trichormus variabilis]MBD2625863.1 hypothetical protein [Trichormus variabilis FACHB-164]RUS93178.1 hypothetical protein DSM107003_44940 [Trichormus variabilis SAG 1403-4b]